VWRYSALPKLLLLLLLLLLPKMLLQGDTVARAAINTST